MDKAKVGGGVLLVAALAASLLLALTIVCAGVRAVPAAPSPAATTPSVQGEAASEKIITGSYEKVIKDTVSVDDNAAAYHFRRTYEYKVTDEYPVAVEGEDGGNV